MISDWFVAALVPLPEDVSLNTTPQHTFSVNMDQVSINSAIPKYQNRPVKRRNSFYLLLTYR